jgi:SAM-dependent methyltransferase
MHMSVDMWQSTLVEIAFTSVVIYNFTMLYGKRTELDDDFVLKNLMGPNCLTILEELMSHVSFAPGSRVLDLGCGTGLTSIFLAQEYDVQVFATDLWIDATDNHKRFSALGLDDRIIPIHADAHNLPYANDFFDAVISVDSYQYYGADQEFLDAHLAPLVKPDGIIAVSMPGLQPSLEEGGLPDQLKAFWHYEIINFNNLAWWEDLWSRSKMIGPVEAFPLTCHRRAWGEWLASDNDYAQQDVQMMEVEGGKYFDTLALVSTRVNCHISSFT